MVTQAPPRSAVLAAIGFALSCVLLVIFAWVTFGGSVPFSAQSYRIHARFQETGLLAPNADVRISGINVGKVEKVEPQGLTSLVTLDINPSFVPLAASTSAILRQKTLIGEAFVELSPGTRHGPSLPDGGTLPEAQVQQAQQLDQVIGSFDQPTQQALQDLLQGTSEGLAGRGADLNAALGNLAPTTTELSAVVGVLDDQQGDVRSVINGLGTVLTTLGQHTADVRGLVQAGDSVLATTAAHDRALSDTVNALPPFMASLRVALRHLNTTLGIARPTLSALTPVAGLLPPALSEVTQLSGPAVKLLHQAPELLATADRAVPSIGRFSAAFKPAVDALLPAAEQLMPLIDYISLYPREVTGAMGHLAAFLNASAPATNGISKYLRVTFVLNDETPFGQARRPASNRHNSYAAPGELANLAHGLESSDCANAGSPTVADRLPIGNQNVPCVLQPKYPWPAHVSALRPSIFAHIVPRKP